MRTRRALLLGAAIGLLGIGPAMAVAQQPGQMQQQHQQMRMQQMQQLHQSMERMMRIQERAQTMERQMAQAMERLHQNPELAARNAEQLRNQERLRSMAQATNDGAREMHRAMEQLGSMLNEPGAMGNQEMRRDMEQLRIHWEEMAGQMEEGLQIMESLRDRLRLDRAP